MHTPRFIVLVVDSLAGAEPLIDLLRRAGVPDLHERFTPEAVAASGQDAAAYARSLADGAADGVVWTVLRVRDLRTFPLRKTPGQFAPRYIFVRQPDLFRRAAELAVDAGGTSTDLGRLRAALGEAAAYGPDVAAAVGSAPRLKLDLDSVAADPARAAAKMLKFAGVAPPREGLPASLDLAPGPAVAAALQAIRTAAASVGAEPAAENAPLALVLATNNDEDIVFANLAWHFAAGARAFVVMDAASADSTRAEVARFVRACEPLGARVLVVESREPPEGEGRRLTAAARLAQTYFGARWIVGLGADEFLDLPDGLTALTAAAEAEMERVLGVPAASPLFMAGVRLPLIDHLCTRLDRAGDPNPLSRMAFRWRKPRPPQRTAVRAAVWAPDLRFGPRGEAQLTDGTAVPAQELSEPLRIRRFQVRSYEHLARLARERADAGPTWSRCAQRLAKGGEPALKALFETEFQLDPAELVYDPMPALLVQGDGVVIDRSVDGRRPPLNLPLSGMQRFAVGGVPFEPESISLKAAPAPRPVRLRAGSSDIPTFLQVFARQEYAIELPIPPAYILDLGANIGLAAAYLSGRFPDARIVSVEPDDDNYRMLLANTEGYDQVTAVHAAVWSDPGVVEIVDTTDGGAPMKSWGFRTVPVGQAPRAPGRGVRQIRAMTIPEIVREAGFPRIDLLKVDIEGAELELFSQGDLSWIGLVQQAVVETHDRFRPGSTAAVRAALAGFEETRAGENLVFVRRAAAASSLAAQ